MKIRRADINDVALLTELATKTFVDTFAAFNTPENMAAYLAQAFGPAQQSRELSAPDHICFIAEIDDQAVGYALLHVGNRLPAINGDKPIELVRLYARKDFIGHGIGPALMRACIEQAKADHHDVLWLGVWEHNPRAQAFYQKWGFETVGSHIFELGSDRQQDLLMQLSLHS